MKMFLEKFFRILDTFWNLHPTLLYALVILLGTFFAIAYNPVLFFPLLMLTAPIVFIKMVPFSLLKRLSFALLLFIISFVYVKNFLQIPENDVSQRGSGIFSIQSIEEVENTYGKKLVYRGHIKQFRSAEEKDLIAHNVPCVVFFPHKENLSRYSADCDYFVTGILEKDADSPYSCMLKIRGAWIPVPYTISLAEYRYLGKKYIGEYINGSFSKKKCSDFLKGISTGVFDDKEMKFEFSRFGLQHIMAISGFHFAIVAGFFNFFFGFFFNKKKKALFLMGIMCAYLLFLGPGASVMRAWMMIMIVMIGKLLEKNGNGPNSLGMAVILLLIWDPYLILHIGFQFSVLVTGSILITYPLFDHQVQTFFPRRDLHEVIQMHPLHRHGYCMVTYIRKAIALTFAVNVVALPLTLYHFNKFPVMGILYNWFFPFMVSLSIIFLILGILFFLLPPLAGAINLLNQAYTQFVLDFTYRLPTGFDYFIRTRFITYEMMVIWLTLLFVSAVLLGHILSGKEEETKKFSFI